MKSLVRSAEDVPLSINYTVSKMQQAALLGMLSCVATLCGCHNRAYNDLYIENMAAEIRGLEDQLYEYDQEYRALEQELATQKALNARASQFAPQSAPRSGTPRSSSPLPLEFQPRSNVTPNPLVPEPVEILPGSILEPTISSDPATSLPGSGGEAGMGSNPNLPTSPFPSRAPSSETLPSPADFESDGFDPSSLEPPTIEPGEPMPPQLPVLLEGLNASQSPQPNSLEMNLSRIEVPAQLAGASEGRKATITLATEKVTDHRVVEIAFHPSLSRAANFDDRSDHDGLYLVLQPRNERGQMVPEAAQLTVVVLDPAREGNAARIGRWDYTAEEVKAKMQPIGTNQGIHLTLPWNGPDPSADRVIVFAKYTFENGRQVIGQKEIFVSSDGGLKTVWAPRGSSSAGDHAFASGDPYASSSRVTQASSEGPVPSATNGSSTNAVSTPVVRPASGSLPLEAAPTPDPSGNWSW